MDYNSSVSLILPDTIGLIENDFDDEDIVHEQKNQNEIVELIMAAFEGHDEPSDDDDDDQSSNTTDSSHHSSDDTQTLNINNNNNSIDELYTPGTDELHEQQSSSKISKSPSRNERHTVSFDPSIFSEINDNESNTFQNKTSQIVHYQKSSSNSLSPIDNFHYHPTIDINDPMQTQYLNETHNQLNKLRILCSVKDRKAVQLQNLCEEFREKYENETRTLKHQLELSERIKYDFEQQYQLLNTKYEELIETNKQSHRIIKEFELKIQQFESNKKQLEKKYSDSEYLIESLQRKVNDLQQYESIARSQHDYEQILSTTNNKHEQEIFSFNEKLQILQVNLQEKMNEIDELHLQLDLANKNIEKTIFERMESINQLNEQLYDCQRKYTDLLSTNSLESIRQTELQQELTHLTNDKDKLQSKCQQLEAEIRTLRQRIRENDEHIEIIPTISQSNHLEHSLIDHSIINENIHLKERLNEYLYKIKQLKDINQNLTQQLEQIQSKHRDSTSSSSSSTSSNETVIATTFHTEQIRKLTNEIENLRKEKTELTEKFDYEKHEFNAIIEQLRDDLHELDKTKQLYIDICQEKNSIEDKLRLKYENDQIENEQIKQKFHDDFQQELNKIKIQHERQLTELNHELDRLRTNDDAQNRLIYIEKEFEELKQDYSKLNEKHSELIRICTKLENENEKFQRMKNDKTNIQTLEIRINNYENIIKQYEDYRIKLENNLQKLTQQRDTNKIELRLIKDLLTTKENDYNQLKIHFDQYEKHFQNHQEQFRHYENTINDLQKQLDQTRDTNKYHLLEEEKHQLEERLNETNRALALADSHLKKEIEKIKHSLEHEYNRRYEREQQHRQLNNSFHSNSSQDIEDLKKTYRSEFDRLYRENVELSQNQTKLIDAHQKQMQLMKKELDDGYKNFINEYQHEQIRLQTRYDQLKQQYTDSQQLIEQMKINHDSQLLNIQEEFNKKKHSIEYEYRTRQEHCQQRLEKLVKLLQESNDALNQERTLRTRQENEYEQMIHSLQMKLTENTQYHNRTIKELKFDLEQERFINQTCNIVRPKSVPDFASSGLSSKEIKSDYLTTVEKLRELFTKEMIALLRLTCQMIFDVHHRVIVAPCINNLDMTMRKQIDHELIRSRNSMIKEIRREIHEKMTFALKSQGVPDTSIDMHIFELDRLLSQMIEDCLNSFPSSNSTSLSLQITPKCSTTSQSSIPKKSIECLYMTPSMNKRPAPIAPHCRSTLDITRRPKSASNLFIPNQQSSSTHSHTHKYQRIIHSNPSMRMHRSEDDLTVAIQRDQQVNPDDTLAVCEELSEFEQSHEPISTKSITIPTDTHYATTRIINHKTENNNNNNNDDDKEEEEEEELTWPQEPISTIPSNHSYGIKKFVRNSLKLFITQPQHKRTGK